MSCPPFPEPEPSFPPGDARKGGTQTCGTCHWFKDDTQDEVTKKHACNGPCPDTCREDYDNCPTKYLKGKFLFISIYIPINAINRTYL